MEVTLSQEPDKSPFKLVPGVYKEELPNPIMYESYVPIILKYQLPNWNKSEVTFNNWYSCTTETAPFRYTCPVVFHMNKAVLNLHIDFESIQPVQDFQSHDEYYSKLFTNSEFCDTIKKHFSGVYIQSEELDKYIEVLDQCHLGSGFSYTEMYNDKYNFSIRHPFTRIENNFYNTFYKNINSSLDLVASATLSNARSTIQATLLSVFYAEKYRWTHATQDCRAQVIPHSVVTYEKFNETLTQFAKKLASTTATANPSQELSIPLSLISKYYNLPLTDCTFTEDSFVTRILIPIKTKPTNKSNKSKKLVKLNAVPFQYKNRLCQVQLEHEVEERYLYDEETKLAYRTHCQPNELCQLTNFLKPNKVDPCATALLNENFDEFVKSCPFKCENVLGESKVHITRVKPNQYIFFGKTNGIFNDLGKQSPIQKDIHIETSNKDLGAVEITLPCKTKITIGDRILYSEVPCESNTTFTPIDIGPWHFARSKDIKDFDADLMDRYVNGAKQEIHGEESIITSHKQAITAAANNAPIPDTSSHTFIWVFFSIIGVLLFALQIYTLHQLNKLQGGSGNIIQNIFYKVRPSRDMEPELRLINE